jgi:hypothetical protein
MGNEQGQKTAGGFLPLSVTGFRVQHPVALTAHEIAGAVAVQVLRLSVCLLSNAEL